jgi:hypothetical protein
MKAHMKLYLSVMFGRSGLSRIALGLGVEFNEREMSGYTD